MRARIERDRILYPPERSLRPRARAAARKLSRADFSAALRCGKSDNRRCHILHSPSLASAPCNFSDNTLAAVVVPVPANPPIVIIIIS